MGRFTQIAYKLRYRIKPGNAVKIAREIGVHFAGKPGQENCRILTEPVAAFGSEPYLIKLGNHVEITSGVRFITHDGGIWSLRHKPEFQKMDFFGPIVLGNNVFVGNNVIFLPGVTVGDNVVIGAGAVVTKDIPSNSVAAGVPARVIKPLDAYVEKLLGYGAIETKNLSKEAKKSAIEKKYPEWF